MGRVVLVTGVGREVGDRFARRIVQDPTVEKVIGVDVVPPRSDLGAVQFVRADVHQPLRAEVLLSEGVDTVVHLGVIATPTGPGGRTSIKEINVIGTMQLLAACQQAVSVQRLVVKSSSNVYGSSPKDPAMFAEDMAPRRPPRAGFAKDSVEVEGYVRGFSRRRPDVKVTTLRCANVVGPLIRTAFTNYLELPVVPTVLGFDPRLQFCHEEDALDVLHHATLAGVHGTFNVAGDGVLTLAQAVRRLGRPHIGVPSVVLSTLGSAIPQLQQADLAADQVAYLSYGRGLDTTAMRQILGFEPKFTTPEAFEDFARSARAGATHPEPGAGRERQVADVVAKVRGYDR